MFDLLFLTSGGPDYWAELRLPGDSPPRVLVKLVRRGDRYTCTRLIIDGDLDSQTLRAIPMGRIEATATMKAAEEFLLADVPPSLRPYSPERLVLLDDEFGAIDDVLDVYLTHTSDLVASQPPAAGRRREPLTRPDGTDPDGFSRRVAEAYAEAARATRAPATVLAEEADVPVTTVHRWVREARQRGHLPPARKGRAG
ncbi:hypothetical protein [Micromonospora chersina]